MIAHTKGPWQVDYRYGELWVGAAKHPVCMVNAKARTAQPREHADARLIAAAPELLDELRNACDWLEQIEGPVALEARNRYIALIAKAAQP